MLEKALLDMNKKLIKAVYTVAKISWNDFHYNIVIKYKKKTETLPKVGYQAFECCHNNNNFCLRYIIILL